MYSIQKLVAHGLLDGNHPDDCLYPDEERPKSNGMLPRRLIDAIVDEVCKCTTERDQQVQLQVVRALLTIVATSTTEVHERSLLKVMSSLYYIHIACANQVNQNTAKASLIQMIAIVFKKLEQHSGEFSESLRRLGASDSVQTLGSARGEQNEISARSAGSRQGIQPQQKEASDSASLDQYAAGASNSGREAGGKSYEESKGEDPQTDQSLVTFSASEQFAQVTLSFVVDNVCLHAAKVEEVGKKYNE